MASVQSAYDNMMQGRQDLEAKLARMEEEANKKVKEAEERASALA